MLFSIDLNYHHDKYEVLYKTAPSMKYAVLQVSGAVARTIVKVVGLGKLVGRKIPVSIEGTPPRIGMEV